VVQLGGAVRAMGRAGGWSRMRGGGRRPVGSRDQWEDSDGRWRSQLEIEKVIGSHVFPIT
jgi:hypothetical protein